MIVCVSSGVTPESQDYKGFHGPIRVGEELD